MPTQENDNIVATQIGKQWEAIHRHLCPGQAIRKIEVIEAARKVAEQFPQDAPIDTYSKIILGHHKQVRAFYIALADVLTRRDSE